MKIKVLPLTIFACSMVLCLKVTGLAGFNYITVSKAESAEAEKKPNQAVTPPVVPPVNGGELEGGKAPADKKPEAKDGEKKPDEKAEGEKKEGLPKNVSLEKPVQQNLEFTDSEKQLLEKLAARRTKLDARDKDLEMKESLVDASAKKLDEKLAQLTKLKADTEAVLKTYNEHEDVKIKSMVKIYENMKPAAAAQIFGDMDMEIVLEIVDKMAEKKVSPVLAAMDPKKAQKLTENLVKKRSLTPPDVKQAAAMQAQSTGAAPAPGAN